MTARDLEILPLTSDRFPDLVALFSQGGDPKWCWCAYFRVRGMTWSNSTPEENRSVLESATAETNEEGRAPGLVAYREKEAVGWVSLGPRSDYERLAHSRVLAPVDEAPVWSIVCFVVGRQARRQGVAVALLDAAIDYAREHGAEILEAYPVDAGGDRIRSANAYKGTLTMFERAGFTEVARRRANRKAPERPTVRLTL